MEFDLNTFLFLHECVANYCVYHKPAHEIILVYCIVILALQSRNNFSAVFNCRHGSWTLAAVLRSFMTLTIQ
jgi:hypothetical protein